MPPAFAGPGAPLRRLVARWQGYARFCDGAEAGEKLRRIAIGNRSAFVLDFGRQGTLLVRIGEDDNMQGPHLKPERRHRCGMRDEHFADGPSLEFGHTARRDHWNPFALEAGHELLSAAVVGVDEHDGQEWVCEDVFTAPASPFEREAAITDASQL